MKKIPLLFVTVFLILSPTLWGQKNFKEDFYKANPVDPNDSLSMDEKLDVHKEYLDQAIRDKVQLNQMYGYLNLFLDYLQTHDYVKAASYLVEAENLTKSSDNSGWIGITYHLKGMLSIRLKSLEEAIPHYEMATKYCREGGDSVCVAESLEQLGAIHGSLGNYEKAKTYFDLAMPLIEAFGDESHLSAALSNFGIMLAHQDRPDEAIPYYKRSISINQKLSSYKEMAQGLNNLGDAYLRLKRYDLAIGTFDRCIEINKKFNLSENLITNYQGMHEAYTGMGDSITGNEFLVAHFLIKDSIIGAETQTEIADLQAKYERQEKELALQKSQTELDAAQQSLERRTIFILLMLLLVGFGVWRWRIKSVQAKRELAQNQENLRNLTQLLLKKNSQLTALEEKAAKELNQSHTSSNLNSLENNLYNQRILTDEDWEAFKVYFEKTYPGYLYRLRSQWTNITEAEERLFLFIKLNLNRKETAAILGISVDSVKKTRYRLRKRLELSENSSLEEYIRTFGLERAS